MNADRRLADAPSRRRLPLRLAADAVEERVQQHRDQRAEQDAGLQQRLQVVRQVA